MSDLIVKIYEDKKFSGKVSKIKKKFFGVNI